MSINYECTQKAGSGQKKAGCILFLIFLVFISVGTSGCIKLMQQSTGSGNTQSPEALHPDPVKIVITADPITPAQQNSPTEPTLVVTSPQYNLVTDAAPILPPDPYPILHGTRINATPEYNLLNRPPEFTRTYTLRGDATGMIVNVVKGPLILSFDINPLYDCLENPDACRGDKTNPMNRPYFTITVRDNQTHEIIAEDGYAREYSSQKTDRTIEIFGEGQYHLTLTGNYLDVTLSIRTGAAPSTQYTQSPSASLAPAQTLSPEYLRYLRQSGGEE